MKPIRRSHSWPVISQLGLLEITHEYLSLMAIITAVLISIFAIVLIGGVILPRRNARPWPPGPAGYPLIGNALSIPTKRAYVKFLEWKRQYGKNNKLSVRFDS